MSDKLVDYFTRHYTLVLNNDEVSYTAVTKAAVAVIRESDITRSEWLALDSRERRVRFASDIGSRVIDIVEEYVDEDIPDASESIGAMLVREIMIFSDRDLEYALGTHYLPDDSDIVDLLADDDADDDDADDDE